MGYFFNQNFFSKNVIFYLFLIRIDNHGMFLEGVYKIESDTKTEYEGF